MNETVSSRVSILNYHNIMSFIINTIRILKQFQELVSRNERNKRGSRNPFVSFPVSKAFPNFRLNLLKLILPKYREGGLRRIHQLRPDVSGADKRVYEFAPLATALPDYAPALQRVSGCSRGQVWSPGHGRICPPWFFPPMARATPGWMSHTFHPARGVFSGKDHPWMSQPGNLWPGGRS
jgi:hypothetical protein